MKKIKITHINPTDIKGGASLAGYRLHQEFLKYPEIDSVLFVDKKYSSDREVIQFSNFFLRQIERFLNKIGYFTGLLYVFSVNWLPLLFYRRFWQTDVFLIRMVHGGYLPFWFPWLLSKIAPVIWRLPDMWAFTGRCVFSYDCPRDEYPQVLIKNDKLLLKLKKFFYQRSRLYIVCPSKWLLEKAKESLIFRNFEISYIPSGVNPDLFKPTQKEIGIIAIPGDKRKGKELFPQIIAKLNKKVFWVKDLNEKELAKKFGQSKVFILPTLADNLPNTLLESLACETPAVCFDVGGCSDVIKHMETGYLAKPFDIDDFVRGIFEVLKNYQEMGRKGRELILQNFTQKKQAEEYLRLIKSILKLL